VAQDVVVSNTTPLIALAWLDQLDLLPALFGVIYIPAAVYDELHSDPEKVGSVELSAASWLKALPVKNTLAVEMLTNQLDLGESEAIVLAHELSAALLLMDERRGRRRAAESGLTVTGTLGILIEARKRGLVGLLRPLLDRLHDLPFRMTQRLYVEALNQVGESPEQGDHLSG
jgi:predicted nucleic acid-binding protein